MEEIPALLGDVERLRALLWTRLSAPAVAPSRPPEEAAQGNLLTPEQASMLMGVTVRWLYRHQGKLPFARKLSRKTLRFSEAGLRRWLASRRA